MTTTHHTRLLRAPRARVYAALLRPQRWRFPLGMTIDVHEHDPRVGGVLRVSLTYTGEGAGKTTSTTDTYRGTFVELVPDERVVESVAFETTDARMQGVMRITTTLTDVDGGTLLVATHEGLPPGVAPADNEAGWREALDRLAALVDGEA